MPLPASDSLSPLEAVQFVVKATGEPVQRVCTALAEAALAGTMTATGCRHLSAHRDPAKYFAHPVLAARETVPSEAWGAPISWAKSRVGRYDLVRFNRADISRWLAAASDRQSGPNTMPQAAPPSGIRTNKAETAETACREWLAGVTERPPSKDVAFEEARDVVKQIGPLSRKAFERAWAREARAEWKRGGRRRKSPPKPPLPEI
jgi:hypothetical protein